MLKIDISLEAEADIDQIAAYTTRTWGWRQSDIYLAKLEDGISLLAQSPSIGRFCDFILPGLQRFEIGRHVIFYTVLSGTLRIARILHQKMIPAKTNFDS